MKTCGSCKRSKPLSEFYRKGEGHQSMCIPCTKEYHKDHYKKNSSAYKERASASRQRRRRLVTEMKMKPCVVCAGEFHPAAMHFHHRDPGEKSANVAWLVVNAGLAKIEAEIAKCDLICSNCHAAITFDSTGWLKG